MNHCYNRFVAAKNKKIILPLLIIFIVAFVIFSIPNSRASENNAMVSVFEPDEGVCLPVVQGMVAPKGDFVTFLRKFIFYDFYSYGFPFFASSSLVILPLRWLNLDQNIPLVMLTLRQMINVFPMLLALLLLVYIQDGFKTYRSIVLFVFLLSVPAVIRNGLWWHPDSLALLLSVMVLFLLWRDEFKFGWKFLAAAVLCGVLVATKMIGVYFFLAVGLTLIWGVVTRKITLRRAFGLGLIHILLMAVSFILANPFLLSKWARTGYFFTITQETEELSKGYGLVYEKGLAAAWPLMHQYYGEAVFLFLVLGVTFWGIIKGEERFKYALSLAWFIPLTFSLLTFTHFKYQYWLPVALPVFANINLILPVSLRGVVPFKKEKVLQVVLLAIVAFQFILFVNQDIATIIQRTRRQQNNAQIDFYTQAAMRLAPLKGTPTSVYHDYRLYTPPEPGWEYNTTYGMLTYQYVVEGDFDLLFLLNSRIRDYINPNAVAVDEAELAESKLFYQDAFAGSIAGYSILYENETAKLFIRTDICARYFSPESCQ